MAVFEAGLGISGRYWGPTARLLADTMRVVAYDRAGYGGSTADAAPRTLDRLAEDLLAVVRGVPHRRLVLVGHSWGGPVIRRAAEQLPPGAVTGLVLVDPADENAELYFSRAARFGDAVQAATLPGLARIGALRILLGVATRGALSQEDRHATIVASCTSGAADTTVAENRWVRPGLLRMRTRPVGTRVPITVVSGTKPLLVGARAALVGAHRATAAQHPGGRWVEAPTSRHLIPVTDPEIVAREVRRLLKSGPPRIRP